MQGGAAEVKKHKWFNTASDGAFWDKLIKKDYPAPIKIHLEGVDDTRNFEYKYSSD